MTRLQCVRDGGAVGEIATAHIDEDGACFHLRERSGIEELLPHRWLPA
jgi:hypothetical protein